MTETLESRTLFSISAYVDNDTLYVKGDNTDDDCQVVKDGSDLVVKKFDHLGSNDAHLYAPMFSVPDVDVDHIKVYLYAGDDHVDMGGDFYDDITVYGGAGCDDIHGGGKGVSYLYGFGNLPGDANFDPAKDDNFTDWIFGGPGLCYIYGQGGNDHLMSDQDIFNSTSEVIYGGDGDDIIGIAGYFPSDTAFAYGEGGNDLFYVYHPGIYKVENPDYSSAVLSGGPGTDTIDMDSVQSNADGAYINMTGDGTLSGPLHGHRTLQIQTDIEVAKGSIYDDVFVGGSKADTFYGGQGNDVIHGGGGNDKLYGQAGNDTIYGEAGSDLLVGGAGDDILIAKDGFWDIDTVIGGNEGRNGANNGHDTALCDVRDLTAGIDVLHH